MTSSSHQADLFLLRTDSAGNLLWCRSYESIPGEPRVCTGLDILEAPDSCLVVAGSMDKDRALFQYNNPFVLRVTSTGAPLNAYVYESVPPALVACEGPSAPEPRPQGSDELRASTEHSNNPLFGSWELTSVIVAGSCCACTGAMTTGGARRTETARQQRFARFHCAGTPTGTRTAS